MLGKRNIILKFHYIYNNCCLIDMYQELLPSLNPSLFVAFSLLASDLMGVADTGVILSFPMTKSQLNKRLPPNVTNGNLDC